MKKILQKASHLVFFASCFCLLPKISDARAMRGVSGRLPMGSMANLRGLSGSSFGSNYNYPSGSSMASARNYGGSTTGMIGSQFGTMNSGSSATGTGSHQFSSIARGSTGGASSFMIEGKNPVESVRNNLPNGFSGGSSGQTGFTGSHVAKGRGRGNNLPNGFSGGSSGQTGFTGSRIAKGRGKGNPENPLSQEERNTMDQGFWNEMQQQAQRQRYNDKHAHMANHLPQNNWNAEEGFKNQPQEGLIKWRRGKHPNGGSTYNIRNTRRKMNEEWHVTNGRGRVDAVSGIRNDNDMTTYIRNTPNAIPGQGTGVIHTNANNRVEIVDPNVGSNGKAFIYGSRLPPRPQSPSRSNTGK